MFRQYVSNVSCGTGANFILQYAENHHLRARVYLKPEVYGSDLWRFFFANTVDSTFDTGNVAYHNLSGGHFEILSAYIADGGEINGLDVSCTALQNMKQVTFDGSSSKKVVPNEMFWSDEVYYAVPDGHYLVWEWELYGNNIPCTPNSIVPTFVDDGSGFQAEENCPMPMLFGSDRRVKKQVAFIGDSITQGCGTTLNAYEMWVGQIATMLQPEYAVWNLGLGFGRCADAATDQAWLYKAKQADVVIMTFGVNDLLHGSYENQRASTAGEVIADIETILIALQEAGVTVILSTVPPFEFTKAQYYEWRAVNLAIPEIAKRYGCRVYDIASALEGSHALESKYPYGAHPDGMGGKIAAQKFYQTFHTSHGWVL